jgi:hypothetical protein
MRIRLLHRHARKNAALRDFCCRFDKVAGLVSPVLCEEMRGLADGAGISYDLAVFSSLRDGWIPSNAAVVDAAHSAIDVLAGSSHSNDAGNGCTSMCASGDAAGGRVLVGQTKDNPWDATRYHVLLERYEGVKQVCCARFLFLSPNCSPAMIYSPPRTHARARTHAHTHTHTHTGHVVMRAWQLRWLGCQLGAFWPRGRRGNELRWQLHIPT